MLSTKFLINDIKQVPVTFIFEHYCKLNEKLAGQEVKIKSLWKNERTPSMCIFCDKTTGVYKFKDFSSGKFGNGIELVCQLYNLTYGPAVRLIIGAYNDYILHNNGSYNVEEFKQYQKYKVDSWTVRGWDSKDQYYWTQFNIGSRLLEEHHVKALESYHMSKTDENGEYKELLIKGSHLYGYFKADGSLYKIYQPKVTDKKFIKVSTYIQGSEQLRNHPTLIITSSLKDMMSLKSLKLRVDYIAPDSENTMIPKDTMHKYLEQYRDVMVLFDYDEAGITAMEKYRSLYPVKAAVLPLSKDPADSIRDHGVRKVKEILIPIIDKNINVAVEVV